jgi:hypothetical protein
LLLLAVLVALSLVAMTGVFGARDGAYRKRGLLVGVVLLAVVFALFFTRVH